MKLSKLYANRQEFKPITFTGGFNVIYGDVVSKYDKLTGKPHEHNIGKTSLVELIDFMLLKKVTKDTLFGKHKEKFVDWVFFLEIQLNDGKFLTIRRGVNANAKISFKEHFSKDQNFVNETQWTYEDKSIHTVVEDENPINILNDYLAFNVGAEFKYRKTLGYLLRTQNDYRDVFRLDNFRGADSYWKPALYALLGFDAGTLQAKYDLELDQKEEKAFIKKLQAEGEPEEVYKIRAAIEAKSQEKKDLKDKLKEFDFYQQEQSINFELVTNVESEIALLNKQRYALDYEVSQIRRSLDANSAATIDFSDIETLFEEAKVYFPENLKNDYAAVSDFSKQITVERSKYLNDELKAAQAKLSAIKSELIALNDKRSKMLSTLREKDTFKKYRAYQDNLTKIEADIAKYEAQLESAESVTRHHASLEETHAAIAELSQAIRSQIDQENPDYKDIRKVFQAAFREIMNYTALLVVEPNGNGNVNFETAVLNHTQDITGQGDGFTATKALCACFALALLCHYSTQSYFRFAYLDGVLESWGDNPKIAFIELLRNYTDKYGVQFIISVIKSDIPAGLELSDEEIRRKLSEKDLLFGTEF